MQRIIFLSMIGLLAVFSACDNTGKKETNNPPSNTETNTPPPAPAVLNYGVQNGGAYDNDFFGVKLTVPDDWYVQSREENAAREQMGNDVPQPIESLQTIYLLQAYMHEPGSVVEYNAGINMVASNLSQNSTGGNVDDYMKELLNNLSMTRGYSITDRTLSDVVVGGVKMRSATGQVTIEGIKISQQYLAVFRQGYAMQITLSWANDVQKNALNNVLKTAQFY
ncbi:MAG: hypothetical protein R3C61_12170 [Bacteroidia bacterium]